MFGKKDDRLLCGFDKQPCIQERCMHWVHIRGKHPQSNAEIDMPDCALRWLPILMIEATQQTRQAGAAIESFRNEMVSANRDTAALLISQRAALLK